MPKRKAAEPAGRPRKARRGAAKGAAKSSAASPTPHHMKKGLNRHTSCLKPQWGATQAFPRRVAKSTDVLLYFVVV